MTASTAGIVPWPADLAAHYRATGLWHGIPLGERLRAVADTRPERLALVDGHVRLTHRELWQRADGAALRLAALGLRPDDRIVVQLPNRWEFVVLTLACLRLGVIPVMALPAHRRHELTYLVEHAEARAIAVPGRLKDFDHQETAHSITGLEHVLVAGDDVRPGSVGLSALCAPAGDPARARAVLDAQSPDAASPAFFLLSGGTTGMPKLIPRTHDDYGCGIDHSVAVCEFGPDTVFLAAMPAAHSFTLGGPGILGALLAGGRAVLAPAPDPAVVFPLIESERVTCTGVVPAVAQRWLDHQQHSNTHDHRQHDDTHNRPQYGDTHDHRQRGNAQDRRLRGDVHDLSSLRSLQIGGAKPSDGLVRRITRELGCVLQQGYGMAEGLICFTRPDDPEEVVFGTQGRPICPADELRLIDEDGRPVRSGEPGILLTRGPCTPRGYYRAPEHNARAFTADGWYVTGDIVRLRPDGNLVVEGRDKDMINRGGEKISAEEVENLAYRVDGIRLAAAVAMPDETLGERVCLYAVPRAGTRLELEDVVTVMREAGVARFKLPERLVVVDTLPLTAVGKIDKKALRADIQRRIAAEDGISAPVSSPPGAG